MKIKAEIKQLLDGSKNTKVIKTAEVVAYDDLGPEAIHKLEVEELQAVVVMDREGNNLCITATGKYKR